MTVKVPKYFEYIFGTDIVFQAFFYSLLAFPKTMSRLGVK